MEMNLKGGMEKQQKIMILMTATCFVMMIVVIILGWYVFDYSSIKIQKNNEAMIAILKNTNLEKSSETQNITTNNKNNTDFSNLSADDVVKMVNRHMLLADGQATVATVTNIDGLRTDYPELFTYAKNGDKMIFYALGIIIYDPVMDRVVDVIRRLPENVVVPKSVTEEK